MENEKKKVKINRSVGFSGNPEANQPANVLP
jgi:hypothetical protein